MKRYLAAVAVAIATAAVAPDGLEGRYHNVEETLNEFTTLAQSNPTLARLVAYRPEGAFEAVTRSGQDGEPAKVYARYVGEPT